MSRRDAIAKAKANRAAGAGTANDLRSALSSFDGTFPDNWEPEAGDMIVGTIVRYGEGPRTKFGKSFVVTIHDTATDRDWSVWLSQTTLKNEFRRLNPQVGEQVGIKYFGKRTSADGVEYHAYKVITDRKQDALSMLGPEPEPEIADGEDDGLPF